MPRKYFNSMLENSIMWVAKTIMPNLIIDFITNGGRRQEGNKKRRGFFTLAFVDEPPRRFVLNKENINIKLERTVVISA